MRRLLLFSAVLAASGLGVFVPTAASSAASHVLSVGGTEVGMYPTFDPATARYAATTTAASNGTLQITATTSDPAGTVEVNGTPTTSATTPVAGLSPGDEVSVVFDDADGRKAYWVMYLPAGFPALSATTRTPDQEEPGLIGLTLNAFDGVQPAFGAIVDRNGVPVYAVNGPWDTDLKQQPNGDVTVSRATSEPGHTGYSLVTLDPTDRRLPEEPQRYDVAGTLTDTDGHDSVRLADGSTILIGYEPRGDCSTGYLDATIQKQDAAGNVVFQWSSQGLEGEALNTIMWPTGSPCQRIDYAHINSVVSVEDGDIIASFRHLSAAYRIATVDHDGFTSGQVIWRLGGRHSTFTFPNDPLGGPCAQHTVSQLPNGHVLVFDNGTSGFCVDPSNPTGSATDRGYTRISEYALDPGATPTPTATLVWSYPQDQSKHAAFAGSARRMHNGNTLIGWAADRSALATEVDTQGNTVWELKAADPPAGSQRYATYRAELITALRPAATMSGPADRSTVVQGSVVPAAGSCADWVGHAFDGCATSGAVGGHLDTSTLGSHTWRVTATDGSGNTSSVARSYTVWSGVRPDGLIRKHSSTWWRGGNVYGSAADQTVRQHVHRRHTVASFWRVQNDGERTDAFTLTGTHGTARYKVRYFAGGVDVTRAVVAGTYRTATLAPGARTTLRVEVTPTARARVGRARTFTLRATSATTATAIDRVATRVTARR